MIEKPKPCNCGSDDLAVLEIEQDHAQVTCRKCGSSGPIEDQIGDYTRPIKAWNHRPIEDELVEALEAVLDVEDMFTSPDLREKQLVQWRDRLTPQAYAAFKAAIAALKKAKAGS